ncbi:hypothetical protein, partial [Paenibacillus gorillae]|uniref:hypothetical protein n=1 Tax=Paenibacillus gorillae TaxID=1243662 RepID=UPI0005A857AE
MNQGNIVNITKALFTQNRACHQCTFSSIYCQTAKIHFDEGKTIKNRVQNAKMQFDGSKTAKMRRNEPNKLHF